jgi:CBS domain-containing protein
MSFAPNPRRPSASDPPLGLHPLELSRNLKVDSISRLEPSPPHSIDITATAEEAVAVMRAQHVGCLLVTDSGKTVGIFTERDLLRRVLARSLPLDTPMGVCMTANPVTVSPKDPVRTAIHRMEDGGYRHLPVVDEDGRPVGILSARRVVHYLVEHFPALVFNLPPDLDQYPESADGA